MSATSFATGLSLLGSCNNTTGFSVATSIASTRTSNKLIGSEGTRCVVKTRGRSLSNGVERGGHFRGTATFEGFGTSWKYVIR